MLRPDPSPRRPTNPSLGGKVLDVARDLGMNIPQAVDAPLAEEIQRLDWARWNEDNQQAVADYNARNEREGLPLAECRTFMNGR